MMRTRLLLPLVVFVILLAACAPEATATPLLAAATESPTVAGATETLAAPTVEAAAQPTVSEATALPVATSRGPDLHATDPSTVSLAAGGLQFVEFFRFT